MNHFSILQASKVLKEGGIIAYPTEAVFGLGCDPTNLRAIRKILTLKKRSPNKGLILIAANFDQLQPYLGEIDSVIFDRVMQSWPGPVTWLLPVNPHAPKLLHGQYDLQAVRVSNFPLVQDLCNAFGGAIVSTSANQASRPPARNSLQVRLRLGRRVDYILDASVGELKQPSTIKNALTGEVIRLG